MKATEDPTWQRTGFEFFATWAEHCHAADRCRSSRGRPLTFPCVGRYWRACSIGLVTAGFMSACSVATVSRSDAPAPREKVDTYLSALERGHTADAYASLCASRRRHESPSAFEKRVAATASKFGSPVSHEFLKSDELSNGLAAVKYKERSTTQTVTRTATLDHDGQRWCVSGIH